MQTILITGANRGLGLELTRQYLQAAMSTSSPPAATPERADELKAPCWERDPKPGQQCLQLDINDESSDQLPQSTLMAAETRALDLLINNAGIFPTGEHQSRDLGNLSAPALSEVITTNAVAPLILTQACIQLLQAGENPRVVMISSGLGSVTNAVGGSYGYRMSKAAMNMAARALSHDGAPAGIITITTHPGWVQTDMGGPSATVTPAQSAAGLRTLINCLKTSDNGKFYLYDGSELPW